MKKYFNKFYIIIYLFLTIFSYFLSVYIVNNRIDKNVLLNNDSFLFLIIFLVLLFFTGFIIFDKKEYSTFVFRKRWYIALIFLMICVLGKFNFSSYGMWNSYIQPNSNVSEMEPLIGSPLAIRSDEWLTTTPIVLSQRFNDYSYFSDISRSQKTAVFMYGSIPIKNILIFAKPFSLFFMLFGNDYGISFSWIGRIVFLFMLTFEFLLLLTKKNKSMSLFGAILVCFSAPVGWWGFTIIDIILGGEGAVLFFDKFINSKSLYKSFLYLLLMCICILLFGFVLYPAWIIPFAYIYGMLALCVLYKNIKYKKFDKAKIIMLIIAFLTIVSFVVYFYIITKEDIKLISNTVYPGKRFVNGGTHYDSLFYYMINNFMAFKDVGNPCEISVFYSLIPLTVLLLILYYIKNKKRVDIFVLALTIVMGIFSIFIFIGFPNFLAKISLLYMTPVERMLVPYTYLFVIVLSTILSNLKLDNKKINVLIIMFSMLLSTFIMLHANTLLNSYINSKVFILSLLIEFILTCLCVYSYNNFISKCLIIFSLVLFGGIFININPISKGINAIYDKPISKEIKKIIDENKDYKWISLDDITTGDYLIANGAKTINSTNFYPNFDLWYKIDKNHEYSDIYNRYAHIVVNLTKDSSSFTLKQDDVFAVDLNYNDVCLLDVSYLTSRKDISNFENKKVYFEEVYYYDGLYIYKINCLS